MGFSRRTVAGITGLLCLALTGPVVAQSLGDAAAREKKRREALEAARKRTPPKGTSYVDQDLPKNEGAAPSGDGGQDVPPARSSETEEADKRARALEIKAELEQCRGALVTAREALKAAENDVPVVPKPSDDPFNEEPPAEEGAEPTTEEQTPKPPPTKEERIRDAKAVVRDTAQRCEDIEDQARKERIPPGWIR